VARVAAQRSDEVPAHPAPEVARGTAAPAVAAALQLQRTIGNRATARALQRVVRITAPRSGATAAGREQELVDRLNSVSTSVWWDLDGDRLQYWELVGIERSPFDERMIGYVDREDSIPLRLITRHGLSRDIGSGPGLGTVFIDQLQEGYVDLDDMLACDDTSFQLNLIHFIEERFAVRNYERRIGTDMSAAFPRAHARGLREERDYLRDLLGDQDLRSARESGLSGGGTRFSFRGDGYTVRHDFRSRGGGLEPGSVTIRSGGRNFTVEEWLARPREGAAAAAP
jgi:hypothetical protein